MLLPQPPAPPQLPPPDAAEAEPPPSKVACASRNLPNNADDGFLVSSRLPRSKTMRCTAGAAAVSTSVARSSSWFSMAKFWTS